MNNFRVYLRYREQAILLRKKGKTYSEILAEVPVAKSTLSLWLRSVFLAKKQTQRITEKKKASSLRGALSKKLDRIEREKIIYEASKKEISKISKRELWLIGVALYWAEGSKSKIYNPSAGVVFTNSDCEMIQVFVRWLKCCCGIKSEELSYEIYIHDSCKDKIAQVVEFWSRRLGVSENVLMAVRYKSNKIKTKRRNIGDLYNGCLRVKVKASSTLNRKIVGWIGGIVNGV